MALFYAHHILRPKETITVATQIAVLLCPGNCLSVRSIPSYIRKGGGSHGFVPAMGMIEQHLGCVAPGDGNLACVGPTDGNIIQIEGGHPFKAGVGADHQIRRSRFICPGNYLGLDLVELIFTGAVDFLFGKVADHDHVRSAGALTALVDVQQKWFRESRLFSGSLEATPHLTKTDSPGAPPMPIISFSTLVAS